MFTVMTELEGLQKCSRVGSNATLALSWVCGAGSGVRLATSLGSLLASRAFTDEKEQLRSTNDDKVLATALNLHANLTALETGKISIHSYKNSGSLELKCFFSFIAKHTQR